MKKIVLFVLMGVSVSAFAQSQKKETVKRETNKPVSITNSRVATMPLSATTNAKQEHAANTDVAKKDTKKSTVSGTNSAKKAEVKATPERK